MSIATKLQKILDSKAAIKTAIAGKGGTITDATPLDEYAQAVQSIPSGDDSMFISVLDRSATSIDIPSGTTVIGNYALYGFDNLQSITIPSGVTSLGRSALAENRKLQSITLPSTVVSIGREALYLMGYSATSASIILNSGLITIGISAFRAAQKVASLIIPDTVETIENSAFAYMHGLQDLVIGSGIITLGNDLIYGRDTGLPITLRVYATTPPTLGTGLFQANTNYKIYVPDASVNAYKTATNWSTWADYIYPLSEYQP